MFAIDGTISANRLHDRSSYHFDYHWWIHSPLIFHSDASLAYSGTIYRIMAAASANHNSPNPPIQCFPMAACSGQINYSAYRWMSIPMGFHCNTFWCIRTHGGIVGFAICWSVPIWCIRFLILWSMNRNNANTADLTLIRQRLWLLCIYAMTFELAWKSIAHQIQRYERNIRHICVWPHCWQLVSTIHLQSPHYTDCESPNARKSFRDNHHSDWWFSLFAADCLCTPCRVARDCRKLLIGNGRKTKMKAKIKINQ